MRILIVPLRDKLYRNIGISASWCVGCGNDFVTHCLPILVSTDRIFLMMGKKENLVFLWVFLIVSYHKYFAVSVFQMFSYRVIWF